MKLRSLDIAGADDVVRRRTLNSTAGLVRPEGETTRACESRSAVYITVRKHTTGRIVKGRNELSQPHF